MALQNLHNNQIPLRAESQQLKKKRKKRTAMLKSVIHGCDFEIDMHVANRQKT